MDTTNKPSDIDVIAIFVSILEELGIKYALGGSIASSVYGRVRFTQDADITLEPFDDKAESFFEMVKDQFYISKNAMKHALIETASFNIIHLATAFKIDLFIRKNNIFGEQVLKRARNLSLSGKKEKKFSVVSPEDIILLKLLWYRDSGCSLQKQLEDVTAVFEVQADRLDLNYLKEWGKTLGISELINKFIKE